MIPNLSTLLKTLAAKTVFGLIVVTMGVGAAAAGGTDFTGSGSQAAPDDQLGEELEIEEQDGDDNEGENDDQGEDGDDGADGADGAEKTDKSERADEAEEEDGDDAKASVAEESAEAEGAEDERLEATCPPAEVSGDEVLEWKVVKTQCRDAWHDLRDEKQAEWLEAKAAFKLECGDDDDGSVEPTEGEGEGDMEMTPECRLLKDDLKAIHEAGKSEWKEARRTAAKVVWKDAKDAEKADQRADRDAAKAEHRAEHDAAKAERKAAKRGK